MDRLIAYFDAKNNKLIKMGHYRCKSLPIRPKDNFYTK
jgi:hypothetical protein